MDQVDSARIPDFQALFEATPNLCLVLDHDLTIVAATDAYCRATKTKRAEIVGRHVFDAFPDNPDDPSASGVSTLKASLIRVLETRQPDTMAVQKYDIRRPDSEGGGFEPRFWAQDNRPVLDARGEVAWIIHRVEDVTEMIQLQARQEQGAEAARSQLSLVNELQKTSEFLDAVIENLPGMLFVKSFPDCRFLLFNRSGEELLGYSRADLLGKNDYDFFPKEQADHFVARDRAVFEIDTRQLTAEEPIDTRSSGTRLLKTTKVAVRDKDGKPQYLLGYSEDITERRRVEQQLRQAVKMEAVGQLTGGIAHDFNNLLGVIIGNLDIAAEQAKNDPAQDDPTLADAIGEALNGALRGAELTRRLLAFARNQPLQPTVIDLNQGLPSIARMLRRTIGETIAVELHPTETLWPVRADPAQMDEAILNLAINARDAMTQGGTLSIETANVHLDEDYATRNAEVEPGDYVQLAVNDTGTGMAPEVIEHCFEPFFTTKGKDKGTGLGLSMVYGFVKQSGGHIKIYSELGHGTSVKIYLPRVRGAEAAKPRAEVAEPVAAHGRETILVVEDNKDLRLVTSKQLGELGYAVLEADSAKAALEALAEHPEIDLMFSDIIMPGGMTGTDLARAARLLYPKLKIMLTSGYTAKAMGNGFHDLDGLELLNKPFRKRDLAQRLRRLLDR